VLVVVGAFVTGCSGYTSPNSGIAFEHIDSVCVLLMILSLARLMLKRLKKPWYRSYMDDDIHPCQEVQEPLAVHHEGILPFFAHHHGMLLATLF
jgi:hypothetical protein